MLTSAAKLFQRDWFIRIWTLQEYASARDARFLMAINSFQRNTWMIWPSSSVMTTKPACQASNWVWLCQSLWVSIPSMVFSRSSTSSTPRIAKKERPPGRFTCRLLSIGSVFETTDPCDFVYALFALSLVDQQGFPIDYTESATALSRRAGMFLLTKHGNEFFLHAAAGVRSNYGSTHSSWGGNWDLASRVPSTTRNTSLRQGHYHMTPAAI
jgi:hypothetical protein